MRQAEAAECGLACIAMVAAYHGYESDMPSLRRRFGVSMQGSTLRAIISMCGDLGLAARPVRCELEELGLLNGPAILHWGMNHFVVLVRVSGQKYLIHDPAAGIRRIDSALMSDHFTGVALELAPSSDFAPRTEGERLTLWALFDMRREVLTALGQSVSLSLMIEALGIAIPLFTQIVIDRAIAAGNMSLLTALAMAFGIVVALRLAGRAVRSLTLQYVSGVVSYDMQTKLFRRLLHLPLDWFQKRQVGDIQNRFRSLQPIQQFISNGLVASLLDGGLGAVVLVLMFYYSAALGIVVVCSLTIYIVLRLLLLEMSQRMASDALVSEAREQSRFLETLRAAQTIKASGAEAMREAQQRNAIAATIGASMRVGNLSVSYGAAAEAVTGLTDVVIVFAAASAIMSGDMTVGMFMAFMAYKLQFIDRSMRLIETVISWRLLDVQLDRVADIALSSAEPTNVSGRRDPIAGAMECHDVAFSYGSHERAVLANFNLLVRAGECVAIAGPSGCGKSTLVKLITGLYQPTSGAICIDDVPMPEWDHQFLRSRIGVVTQDDALMTGSVAENIAGFDDQVDFERVRECARTAHIDADIMSMPMGYGTLVGDLGSSLSGGQRQRIMIARALYRAPSILVLDEATSHLDVENERAINAALGKLKITRIIVAHRPETLRSADRIEFIGPGGRRVDVPPLLQPTG